MNWEIINFIGLLLDFIGLPILYFYGIKSASDARGKTPQNETSEEVSDWNGKSKKEKIILIVGFVFALLGFVLQSLSRFCR